MLGAPRPPRAPPAVRADPPRALLLPPRRRPAPTTAPPARCLSGKKLRAQCLEKLARAGRRFARAPEFPAERERPGTLCNSPAGQAAWHLRVPPAPASPSPHTHARICTRARTHTSAHGHSRARSRLHTLRVVTKEEEPGLPYFSFSSLFCSPPDPRRRARPPPPRPPRPATAAGCRHSRAARPRGNFAPGRPRLAARRAGDKSCGAAGGRAAKVCSLIVRKCVCARREPGGGEGAAGWRGRGEKETHPPAPPLARAGHPNPD